MPDAQGETFALEVAQMAQVLDQREAAAGGMHPMPRRRPAIDECSQLVGKVVQALQKHLA
jgi:hypothetical protein